MSFHNRRRVDLKIYFKDSPTPLWVENVCHIGTEGGLLRIMTTSPEGEVECQWWPLCNVFNIRQIGKPKEMYEMGYMIIKEDIKNDN